MRVAAHACVRACVAVCDQGITKLGHPTNYNLCVCMALLSYMWEYIGPEWAKPNSFLWNSYSMMCHLQSTPPCLLQTLLAGRRIFHFHVPFISPFPVCPHISMFVNIQIRNRKCFSHHWHESQGKPIQLWFSESPFKTERKSRPFCLKYLLLL